ncbi:ABC transporter permease [Deinococcus peraridilitoris]|uniref:ABC-type dipeptide/oligopeptide/nickel transport system, permease component n=1 Tax=Deinococcus peraridilitoris (strain DSM 19664 / LMG 22246 / CIP 109416 / KR-200) TaxID=937777 RepID=L0A6M1_DEIPD|nr:ABC-type dipeptide/oligopeptide/nickel transport system, permease component [Deinococcus peraridilitoris DSM 19664]
MPDAVVSTPQTPSVNKSTSQSQWQIAWKQFRKHRLAQIGGGLLIMLYLIAIFAPFLAPDPLSKYSTDNITKFHPPTPPQFRDPETGRFTRPFVYGYSRQLNLETFQNEYMPDTSQRYPIYFFVQGEEYRMFGLFPSRLHLYGVQEPGRFYIMGADTFGRDLFSRSLYAAQISLTIGVGAVLVSTIIGIIMGAIAAYFGGLIDNLIMRLVEVIAAIPGLFLLISLRAIFPADMNPILALYVILGILAFISWGGLAREVRSQLLSVRQLDYVAAATSLGADDKRIIFRHMLPSITTFLIVSTSLAIPGTILAESGLSFLGIGAVEPYASWGSLLNQAREGGLSSITDRPWVLIPGFFIVFTVACYQLLGDGLRDALDPRKRQ